MHGGHWGGGRIPRTCWPPTDDEPLRYEFGAPPFLNFMWISHSIKGRHNGENLFWLRIPTATSIINKILPIISAEPALFVDRGVRTTQTNFVDRGAALPAPLQFYLDFSVYCTHSVHAYTYTRVTRGQEQRRSSSY